MSNLPPLAVVESNDPVGTPRRVALVRPDTRPAVRRSATNAAASTVDRSAGSAVCPTAPTASTAPAGAAASRATGSRLRGRVVTAPDGEADNCEQRKRKRKRERS